MIGKFSIAIFYAIVSLVGSDMPGSDQYILSALTPLLNPLNGLLFDGPASVSNAPTVRNRNILPTVRQIRYYNYYTASMYYGYDLENLSCEYCEQFEGDVDDHEGINKIFLSSINCCTFSSVSSSHSQRHSQHRGTCNRVEKS